MHIGDGSSSFTGRLTYLNDTGRYEYKCPYGHDTVIILQQQKFEILFEIGAYAITDGYYREAISSFSSALERFYEFFVKVLCHSKGIDEGLFNKTWQDVSKQSERQLGAFIFIYLYEFGKQPTILNNTTVKFRNDVIHKGIIPSKEKAIEYGQKVFDLINPLIKLLKEHYSNSIHMITAQHMNATQKPLDQPGAISSLCITTILSLTYSWKEWEGRTLEEAISQLRIW